MLGFLKYTVEAGIIFAVLAAIYKYVYRGASYNRWERGFLLAATAASYVLPLLKVRFYTQPRITRPVDSVVDIISLDPVDIVTLSHERTFAHWYDRITQYQIFDNVVAIVFALYIAGVAVKMVSYINGIRKTLRLRHGQYTMLDGGIRLYRTSLDTVAFSFFGNIFLGRRAAQLSREELDIVVAHETNHIRGLHSLDTVVYGFYSVVQWFNPMVREAARESRAVCENIADSGVSGQATEYSRLILRLGMQNRTSAYGPTKSSGAILQRIAQLLSKDGDKIRRVRFVCTLPVMALVMAAYMLLSGMANPISTGLPVPVEGSYNVTAGYFDQQRIMDSEGMLYSVQHRQMDMQADASARIFAPAGCRVCGVSDASVSMQYRHMTITIGNIEPAALGVGDTLLCGQTIGHPIAGSLMYLKVADQDTPVNPELLFDF